MGLSANDEQAIAKYVDLTDDEVAPGIDWLRRSSRPTHRVPVPPFLASRAPIDHATATRLLGSFADKDPSRRRSTFLDVLLPRLKCNGCDVFSTSKPPSFLPPNGVPRRS